MAIYHVHCDIIGRTSGGSAVAAAAYRATEKITDRTTGEKHDYTRKEKALFSEILTPAESPEWAHVRAELWNQVEEKENRKNSQFCRSFDIALMKEFDLETNKKLVEQWANENYVSRGLAADVAIHGPHKSNNNTHAHVLVTTRKLNKDGWTEKDREANDREFLQHVRTSWAEIVNAEFERRGMAERIDERTLEAQGIDREPQQHQGKAATAMERRGENPDRKKNKEPEERQEIIVTNEELKEALIADEEVQRLFRERLAIEAEKKRQENLVTAAEPKAQKNPEAVTVLKNVQHVQQLDPENPEAAAEKAEIKKWLARIENMQPKEWQTFTKNMDVRGYVFEAYGEYTQTLMNAQNRSRVIWVERNIEPITKDFEKNYKTKKAEYSEFLATKPTAIAERPGKLKAWLYSYRTDGGEVFDGRDYDKYRVKQQNIINEWQRKKSKPQSELETAKTELKACYEKKYEDVKTAIERHHPTLLQKMKEGSKELLQKLAEFRPVRAMVAAVQRLRGQKDNELELYRQEIQRQRSQNKSQDKDLYQGR